MNLVALLTLLEGVLTKSPTVIADVQATMSNGVAIVTNATFKTTTALVAMPSTLDTNIGMITVRTGSGGATITSQNTLQAGPIHWLALP